MDRRLCFLLRLLSRFLRLVCLPSLGSKILLVRSALSEIFPMSHLLSLPATVLVLLITRTGIKSMDDDVCFIDLENFLEFFV